MAKASAGYSGTPLPQKLGIKPDGRVALVDAPERFALDLPAGATLVDGKARQVDVIVWFVTARAPFAKKLASVAARMQPAGGLSIAIDDTWSGLRLVVRVENRPKPKKAGK